MQSILSHLEFAISILSPLQIGFFFDFPPLIAPAIISAGLTMLLYWYVDRQLEIRFSGSSSPFQRGFVAVPLVAAFLFGLGAFVQIERIFWTYIFILLVTGSAIKGAVLFRFVRKVGSIIRKAQRRLMTGSSSNSSTASEARFFVWGLVSRYEYRAISIVFVGLTSFIALFMSIQMYGWVPKSAAIALSVLITGTVVWTLLWDLRSVIDYRRPPTMSRAPILATIIYIAGTEVVNFSQMPIPYVMKLSRAISPRPISVFADILRFTISHIAILITSQVAVLVGFLIAFFFWYKFKI